METEKKILYFWKQNPENNEKFIRIEFQQGLKTDIFKESRSILGVKKTSKWIENLNIGTIMHMMPITYQDQIEQKDIQFELTKEELWKKVFIECFLIKYKIVYQSVCYFTIATELRFLQHSTKQMNAINIEQNYQTSNGQKDAIKIQVNQIKKQNITFLKS